MFDSETFTQEILSNPTKLTKVVIDAMQATDTGKTVTINDPNNGLVLQMLANNSIFAKFSEKIDSVIASFYPQRAINAEQLYPHLSEFDYVKLMASPATLPFVFAMSRAWIVENSVYYDDNYDRIVIPETSYITMGSVIYSMYYPIEIFVNRNTSAITAFYDGSFGNKLYTLESNILPKVREYTQNGIGYFEITFDMFQFERNIETFTVGSEQGFDKRLSYNDQFYALKVFRLNNLNKWIELEYSLSNKYYDYQTPTAVLSILNDRSEVNVEIPQIYFDNGQVSQSIKIELYSTKGAVNYSLSLADVTGLTANFDTSSSPYAAPLTQMPTWTLVPATTEVQGGSDTMNYAAVREAIVKQRLYDRVAITSPEIIQAGKKAGFDLTRVTDDLTERMYSASNILVDSKDMAIPTFSGSILIADQSLTGDPSTILNHPDGYYTLLPTTAFTISNNRTMCIPMTDGQVEDMASMTKVELVDELNKGIYVRQPFHITLLTNPKSPQASIYNLMSPTMTSLSFIKENAHSAPQLSAVSCLVTHLENGTGGYLINLGMGVSSNIAAENPSTFNVFLTCTTKSGFFAYLPAEYNSTNADGLQIWEVQLATSYHITTDDYIAVVMYDVDGTLSTVDISINQTFNIVTSFDKSFDPTIPVDETLNVLLPDSARLSTVAMMQQNIKLSLGHNLSSQIYCGVNTSWGNDVYKLADETIYYKANVPVFQNNEDGYINTRYNTQTSALEVVQIYQQDDIPSAIEDLEITTTAPILVPSSGSTTAIPNTTPGFLKGMAVRGIGIPVDTIISNITNTVITLSKKITQAIPAGSLLVFTNPSFLMRTTAAQTAIGAQLTVASTAGLLVGQSVFGFDIPAGNTIKTIDSATKFTLQTATTKIVTNNSLLTIINTTAPGVVKVQQGEILTSTNGEPIVIKQAQNQYMIPAILFDGRLFASENGDDQKIIATISQRLQNFANQIKTIDAGLIEDSNVFYKPARTMGYATFNIGSGLTIDMLLELSFTVDVYVDAAVYNTQPLLSTMESSIVGIINRALRDESIISVSDITEVIKRQLGSNVSAVEMGDISRMDNLRLVSLRDFDATPSIENSLYIEADGTIVRKPNILVRFLPKPDTAEVSTVEYL